ncbi:MAG TPA: response regulator [Caulobacterales bacterium]|nr:response regulator [Caulobacterales bacterium]
MEAAPTPAMLHPSDIRTIVVSDNAFERRLVQDLLIALGVREIILAEDMIAAFAQIRLRRPRMIIVDAEMRPVGGFMFARELRRSGLAAAHTPLILCASESSPDFAEAARAAGAHEVVAKPVSADSMRRCLEDALTHKPDFSAITRRSQRRRGDPRLAPEVVGHAAVNSERASRAILLAAIDEGRAKIAGWAASGDTTLIEDARDALERASDTAWTGGGDLTLARALGGVMRLIEAAASGRADPYVLDVSLAAARALLFSDKGGSAIREALAEAVSEVAESRAGG